MKRRLALITAVFMLVSCLPVFAQEFPDMPQEDSKLHDAFEYAIAKKLISGDGTNLNPDNYITYAEALTIISRIKPFDCEEADITHLGVSKDKWYYSTVAKAYAAGYIAVDSVTGTINAEKLLVQSEAVAMVTRVYGKTPSGFSVNELCSRANFVWEIYYQAPDGYCANISSEDQTVTDPEVPTEYTDIKAQKAMEDMQVALGVLSDGTSYVTKIVYRDSSQTDWASGKITSSSRPSSRPDDDDDDDDESEVPTEDDETPTEPPTTPNTPDEETTEPPTQEPTYGEYDGPIDNDKDNVIDDPFNDGWRPPGSEGDDDEGQDGWDEEDDDFNINDDDDPDYVPDNPKEDESENPSEDESDNPSENPSEDESDNPSENPSEDESDNPSENPSEDESDNPSQNPSEDESDALPPSEDEENSSTGDENNDDDKNSSDDNA